MAAEEELLGRWIATHASHRRENPDSKQKTRTGAFKCDYLLINDKVASFTILQSSQSALLSVRETKAVSSYGMLLKLDKKDEQDSILFPKNSFQEIKVDKKVTVASSEPLDFYPKVTELLQHPVTIAISAYHLV